LLRFRTEFLINYSKWRLEMAMMKGMKELRQLLGQRLRQARLDAGMTQTQVAEILGKPQTYVSKCELAQRRVFIDEFMDFASVCDKPFEFYLVPLFERMKEIDALE
jgi:transcriptional regulator with XRE-family HTH domain